jgi:hypothetical protein
VEVATYVSSSIHTDRAGLIGALAAVLMISATGLLGGHAYFLHWGVIQISLANLVIIALMLVVFALALVVPFPRSREDADVEHGTTDVDS